MSRTTLLQIAFMVDELQKKMHKLVEKIRWEENCLYLTFEDGKKTARYLENIKEEAQAVYDYELLNQ